MWRVGKANWDDDGFIPRGVLRLEASDASDELRRLLTERAQQLTGTDDIQVELVTGRSNWDESRRVIGLNNEALDVREFDTCRIMIELNTELWHEVGHVIHSKLVLAAPDTTNQIAIGVLEDGRMERQLLGSHPACRPWLRRNLFAVSGYEGYLIDKFGPRVMICGSVCEKVRGRGRQKNSLANLERR